MTTRSNRLFDRARQVIPGGVNSPVRAGKSVGMDPPFIARASGAQVWDVDGKAYIDYVGSWGPIILGHAHPRVLEAIERAIRDGTSYGAPTEGEVQMAELIVSMVPSIEMVRMVNSGTEATMSAIRLARGVTGRDKIVKFDGCYHGHADSLLVSAGSGVATLGIPGSPGVPGDLARHTLSLPYNNAAAVKLAFDRYGSDIACIIVEPVAGNMGVVLPEPGFLEGLRNITLEHGALLVFDEVITGFRLAPGGAQEILGIHPDLTCLGKIIGGGLPVGAYGGRRDIMQRMAPEGNIYQAGTLSGNPVAMAAGKATLEILENGEVYPLLQDRSRQLFQGLQNLMTQKGIPAIANHKGSMGTLFFTAGPVTDLESAKRSDQGLFRRFYAGMLGQGIYLAPSPFEAAFVSLSHDMVLIEQTLQAAKKVIEGL